MPLNKTIILPDEANNAQASLNAALQEEWILMLVLHAGQEAQTFAELADASAGSPAEPYRVIWSKTPAHIQGVIRGLVDGGPVADALDSTRGFAVSRHGKVCDVITTQEPVPDETRVELAWANAEVGS